MPRLGDGIAMPTRKKSRACNMHGGIMKSSKDKHLQGWTKKALLPVTGRENTIFHLMLTQQPCRHVSTNQGKFVLNSEHNIKCSPNGQSQKPSSSKSTQMNLLSLIDEFPVVTTPSLSFRTRTHILRL